MALREAIVAVVLPVAWRLWPHRRAAMLAQFAKVEADSAWQYLQALQLPSTPEVRRSLFENFVEELEHADMFDAMATKLEPSVHQPTDGKERVSLAARPGGIGAFLAIAFESELEISRSFRAYQRATAKADGIDAVFSSIAEDEQTHYERALRDLEAIAGSPRNAVALRRKAQRRRAFDAMTRISRSIGDVMAMLQLSLVYLVFAPLLGAYCRKRLLSSQATNKAPQQAQVRAAPVTGET